MKIKTFLFDYIFTFPALCALAKLEYMGRGVPPVGNPSTKYLVGPGANS